MGEMARAVTRNLAKLGSTDYLRVELEGVGVFERSVRATTRGRETKFKLTYPDGRIALDKRALRAWRQLQEAEGETIDDQG